MSPLERDEILIGVTRICFKQGLFSLMNYMKGFLREAFQINGISFFSEFTIYVL